MRTFVITTKQSTKLLDHAQRYNNFLRIVRIHSHVKNISILGFKGLFLARTDGKTQTILDFSLHGEEGKSWKRRLR